MDARPDEALLEAFASHGESAALEALIARHWPRAFRVAWRSLGDRHLAEEVAQEAFARVVRGAPRFRSGAAFSPWLYTILLNAVRNAARSRQRERRKHEGWKERAMATATKTDAQREAEAALAEHVSALSETVREAVVLRYLEDLSLKEIAVVLGCPEGTVSSRIRRGLEELRESMAGAGHALAPAAVPAAFMALAAEAPPSAPSAAMVMALAATGRGVTAVVAAKLAAVVLAGAALLTVAVAVALGPSDDPAVGATDPAGAVSTLAAPGAGALPTAPPPPGAAVTAPGVPADGPAPEGPAPRARGGDGGAPTSTDPAAAAVAGRQATPEACFAAAREAVKARDWSAYARLVGPATQTDMALTLLALEHVNAVGPMGRGSDPVRERALAELLGRHGIRPLGDAARGRTFEVADGRFEPDQVAAAIARLGEPERLSLIDALAAAGRQGYQLSFLQPHSFVLGRLDDLQVVGGAARGRAVWVDQLGLPSPTPREQEVTFEHVDGRWRLAFAVHGDPLSHISTGPPVAPRPRPPSALTAATKLVRVASPLMGCSVLVPEGSSLPTQDSAERLIYYGGGVAIQLTPQRFASADELRRHIETRTSLPSGDAVQISVREVEGGFAGERVAPGQARQVTFLARAGRSGRMVTVRILSNDAPPEVLRAIVESLQVD